MREQRAPTLHSSGVGVLCEPECQRSVPGWESGDLQGVDATLGYGIYFSCAIFFMEEQGYDIDPSILYQDNLTVNEC
jgi:hypothetical protein